MEGQYELKFGGQAVGKVEVTREGLYYRFRCCCRLTGAVICRVVVSCGGREEHLGILVPGDGGFALDTRLAAKKLAGGEPEFRVVPAGARGGHFVPLKPEEPFAYIARLKQSYLANRCGVWGIVVEEREELGT